MTEQQALRVIVVKDEDGVFCAQCLEYDICTYGDTLEKAKSRMRKQIEIERALSHNMTGEHFGGIPAAPEFFHKLWDEKGDVESVNSTCFQLAKAA